jgi:hypothetical protein
MYWKVYSPIIVSMAIIMLGIITSGLVSLGHIDGQILSEDMINSSASNASSTGPINLDNLYIAGAGGTFTSLQNGSDNITWITSGKWTVSADPSGEQSKNSSSIAFNATVDMVQTDNPNSHKNEISNFSFTNGSINSTDVSSTLILNGSASIDTELGSYVDVPISIKIIDKEPIIVSIDTQNNRLLPKWVPGGGTISLWIDSQKVDNHFGNTPVYGIVKKS